MKMYPNLRAEMIRNDMTMAKVSAILDISVSTLSDKMNGHSNFSLNEAIAIKKELGVEMPLEELFAE